MRENVKNTPKVGAVGINGQLNMLMILNPKGILLNSFYHSSNITSTFGRFQHRESQTRH